MNKTEKVPAGVTCCVLPYFSTHISRLLKSRGLSQEDETLILLLNLKFLSLSLTHVLDNGSGPSSSDSHMFLTSATLTFRLFLGSPLDTINLQII